MSKTLTDTEQVYQLLDEQGLLCHHMASDDCQHEYDDKYTEAIKAVCSLIASREREAELRILEEILEADDSGDFASQMAHAVGVVGKRYQELQTTPKDSQGGES